MLYRTNVLSLSLLLAVGGIAVSAAVSLPCHDRGAVHHKDMTSPLKVRAMYRQRSTLRRNVAQVISRSILDDLTSSSDETQDNTSDYGGCQAPVHPDSPAGIDLNDPVGGITGWLNHNERIYNTLGLEGELDLIAQSDEKPTGVRIGTLGYPSDSVAHRPFELRSEAEAGSAVFLTPPEPSTDQIEERLDPGADFSSHSASRLMARLAPLGLGLLPNLNPTSVGSANAPGATETSGLVHVLIKAGSPSNSGILCATFYARSALNHTDDDAPIFLERCDSSFLPGSSAGPASFTATQLWQYDPKTHELMPILKSESGMSGQSISSSLPNSNHSTTSTVVVADRETMMPQSLSSSAEATGTATVESSVAAQQTQSDTFGSSSSTYSSKIVTPSQVKIRRVAWQNWVNACVSKL
ncbi:hypothetical protein RSAG8_06825, partial [Rhizoctonia solani AG-8 WAC10335]